VLTLIFGLGNDAAGREAAAVMARKYADKSYYTRLELPENKDYNLDLIEYKSKEKSLQKKHYRRLGKRRAGENRGKH